MNKTFEATEIQHVPNPTAQQHNVRGLSATTYASAYAYRTATAPAFHAKMLIGPRDGRVLTMLKATGPTREDALQALEKKLIELRNFLVGVEHTHIRQSHD